MKEAAALLSLFFLFSFVQSVYAQNDDYKLEIQNIDIGFPKNLISPTPLLRQQGVEKGFHYIVKDGTPGDTVHKPFGVFVSTNTVDFGEITPANPILRDTIISIMPNPFYGYILLTYQDHSLTSTTSNSTIQATTCDNGLCNENFATTWKSPLTYGFGYTCNNLLGKDCAVTFQGADQFRQFPQNTIQQGQVIFSGVTKNEKKAQISLKLNISESQNIQRYINTINYILIPTY